MKILSSSPFKVLKPSCFCGARNHHMRISDILMDGEVDYSTDSIIAGTAQRQRIRRANNICLSPRLIFSRWVSSYKKSKGRTSLVKNDKEERERRREKVEGEFGEEKKEHIRCSRRGLNGESSFSVSEELKGDRALAEVSGKCVNQPSFNLGVGFGLVYLITASKIELSKMMELRTQMEILLQDVKEELQCQRRDILPKKSDSNDNLAHSSADALESSHANGCVPLRNLTSLENPTDSETNLVYFQSPNCDKTRQEKCVEGMDQLEAELEAELEILQLHLDAELVLKHPKQQQMEMPYEDTAPEGSISGSIGEVVDPPEAGIREHFEVPPNELQSRLHELLEARQQERIRELEAALECAKRKLLEKEREVSRWKDTAQLISQHIPETSYPLR